MRADRTEKDADLGNEAQVTGALFSAAQREAP
jgi:hypothetical protein